MPSSLLFVFLRISLLQILNIFLSVRKLEKKTTTKGIAPAPASRVLGAEPQIAPEEEEVKPNPEFAILGKSVLESKEKETLRPRPKQYRDASHLGLFNAYRESHLHITYSPRCCQPQALSS